MIYRELLARLVTERESLRGARGPVQPTVRAVLPADDVEALLQYLTDEAIRVGDNEIKPRGDVEFSIVGVKVAQGHDGLELTLGPVPVRT